MSVRLRMSWKESWVPFPIENGHLRVSKPWHSLALNWTRPSSLWSEWLDGCYDVNWFFLIIIFLSFLFLSLFLFYILESIQLVIRVYWLTHSLTPSFGNSTIWRPHRFSFLFLFFNYSDYIIIYYHYRSNMWLPCHYCCLPKNRLKSRTPSHWPGV